VVAARRGTISFASKIWTVSPRWLRVSLRTLAIPRSGRERDGTTSSTSLTTWRISPGRVGFGQLISPPAPTIPPISGNPDSTSRRMVIAAVCQPLVSDAVEKVSAKELWN
jgi:hypothetical protein